MKQITTKTIVSVLALALILSLGAFALPGNRANGEMEGDYIGFALPGNRTNGEMEGDYIGFALPGNRTNGEMEGDYIG